MRNIVPFLVYVFMDTVTSIQRHNNMAAIRSKNTKPEIIVRKWLWSRGFRYRKNSKRLPGHPDLVLRKYRTCIFVNGCFWHGHGSFFSMEDGVLKENKDICRYFHLPKSNVNFWQSKIMRNQSRDMEEQKLLAEMGWHCITIWECELKPNVREQTLVALEYTLNRIFLKDHEMRYPRIDEMVDMAADPFDGVF